VLKKIIKKILSGSSDANIRFNDLQKLIISLGFNERIRGDHHIYSKTGILEIINIQPKKNGKSKPYQVRQIRDIIIGYKLIKELKNE
jgi:predicted RNA binding protein YcfA (HicA-like mRNA interferase family)